MPLRNPHLAERRHVEASIIRPGNEPELLEPLEMRKSRHGLIHHESIAEQLGERDEIGELLIAESSVQVVALPLFTFGLVRTAVSRRP